MEEEASTLTRALARPRSPTDYVERDVSLHILHISCYSPHMLYHFEQISRRLDLIKQQSGGNQARRASFHLESMVD